MYFILLVQGFDDLCVFLVLEGQLPPLTTCQCFQKFLVDLGIRLHAFRAFHSHFAKDHAFETRIDVAIEDDQLVITVTRKAFDFFTLDLERTFVFFNAVTVEDTYFDNCTEVTRLHTQGCVTHVGSFLTKDRTKKLFFWRHRAFTLWRDLTDKNITRLNVCADVYDTRFVEVAKSFFADVWNIACDFFRAKFRVTCRHFEFFDVDRRKHVVTRNALGDQDRVFVVVTIPRHKRDDHVFAQCQFTHICGWTVCNDFALLNRVTNLHQRTLVDCGVLVRTLELAHAVDVYACIAQLKIMRCAHNDTLSVDLVDDTCAFRHDRRSTIACNNFFNASSDQRRFCTQQWNGLTLHVGTHQCAVRVVVLKERDQRGGNRDQLLW